MRGRMGSIFALSSNGEPHEYCATVGKDGFAGERLEKSGIAVISAEVVREINAQLGDKLQELLQPGYLRDNIMTEGLGDLSDLDPGTFLRVGEQVTLRVQSKRFYSRKIFDLPTAVLAVLHSRGGVVCSVVGGIGTRVRTDHEIEILPVGERLVGAA